MPASFWERDAAYRRRLSVIVPLVLAAYAVLFFATDRIQYEDIPRFIGWKGELQLVPEITVIPEIASVEAKPVPNKTQPVPQTLALDLAPVGEIRESPAQPAEEVQPRVVEASDGTAQIRSMEKTGRPETSYSQTFVLIKAVEPVYPMHERAEGIEGTVTVEMLVDEFGTVAQANVLSRMGPEAFEHAALDAVRQFLFEPPIENGQPSRVWVRLRIKFRITG
jgi:TonB family protein